MEEVQLREFVVCGPFPHGSLARDGFDPLLVEWLDPSQLLSEGAEVAGRRCFRAAAGAGGVLDFAALFGEGFKPFWRLEHGLAYAYAEAEVEEGRYVLLAGSEDGLAVYVNGRCALLQPIARRFAPDFYAVPLRLSGRARLLFKVSRLAGRWRLGARLVRVEAPFCVHAARVVKPDLVRGRRERVYVSLPLVALEDIASVTVRAGSGWRSSRVEVKRLRAGEEVPIALAVEPVQPPSGDEAALDLTVEAGGFREEVELKLRVVGEGEHRVETYLSRVDGSVHSYGLKPPKAAEPRGKYGLLISLHGFKGHPYFSELYGDKDWLFVVGPSARDGEVPYREVGCVEVLELLEWVASRYPVDRDRVYLSGHSMGGYGAWFIGVRYPHLFAAIAPLSSRGDLSEDAARLRGKRGWGGVAELLEHYNPANFVENLSATPVFVSHGSADDIVPVEASRRMVEKLRGAGVEVVYEEVEGAKHTWGSMKPGRYGLDCLDRESIESFLAKHARRVPRRVRAVVDSDRFSKVWWVRVRPSRGTARVDVELAGGGELVIRRAENAAEVEVDLGELRRLGLGGELRVVYGTEELRVSVEGRERLALRLEGGLSLAEGVADEGLRKRVPVTGPFMDAFNRPFLIVYPEGSPACREAALHVQRWWFNWAGGRARLVTDREALAARLERGFNLVLVGGPSLNSYAREVEGGIKAVKFLGPDAVAVRGVKVERESVGVALVYPNPLNPKRYVAIVGGESEEAVEAVPRIPFTLVPDYMVYDPRLLGRAWEGVLESGSFDEKWE